MHAAGDGRGGLWVDVFGFGDALETAPRATTRMPNCFDSAFPPHVAAHADGEWVERSASSSATPRYNLPASFWPTIGSKVHKDLPQHYGKCDDARPSRGLYDWKPRHCSLLPFDAQRVCSVLSGRAIVVVGDSTVLQFFISIVKLLIVRLRRHKERISTASTSIHLALTRGGAGQEC